MKYDGLEIRWLGHDCFVIKGEKTVVIDPFKIATSEKADYLLITHEHFDHCSPEDAKKVIQPSTVVVAIPDCKGELSKLNLRDVRYVKPGDELSLPGLVVKAVPAYNVTKFREPGKVFHPKSDGDVGYVITISSIRLYHTGDSDHIPEMRGLAPDIAFLPVSGTYVMTSEEAAEAARSIKPKLAIPMHYASIVGSEKDAIRFKELAPCKVEILSKE
jgi:L-ascorbate metabolism protein UlaG (beta-lactamase superfamily)